MALVSKILETTLTAGQTSVTFTDSDIPNSLIRVFASNTDVIPVSRTLIGNTLTVTYEAQAANMGVALEIQKQGLEIVDNLTSSDADKALSAKQGKTLKDLIDGIVIPTVPENITDLDDVDVTSIQDGQVLAWNALAEKFVNVDQSGGSSVIYSNTEQLIGKWMDKDLYQITAYIPALPNNAWTNYSFPIANADMVYIYDGFVVTSNGDTFPLELTNDSLSGQWAIRYQLSQSRFSMWAGTDRSTFSAYVTLRYTKTS